MPAILQRAAPAGKGRVAGTGVEPERTRCRKCPVGAFRLFSADD
jgi:hypothetical protein